MEDKEKRPYSGLIEKSLPSLSGRRDGAYLGADEFADTFTYEVLPVMEPTIKEEVGALSADERVEFLEELRQTLLLERKRVPIEELAEELGRFVSSNSSQETLLKAFSDRDYEALIERLDEMTTAVDGREQDVNSQTKRLNERVREELRSLPAILMDWPEAEKEVLERLRPLYISDGDSRHANHGNGRREKAGRLAAELKKLIETEKERGLLFEKAYGVFYSYEYGD